MKSQLSNLLFILMVTSVTSQTIKRVEVQGKIIANEDVEGVTIFNSSSNQGTVADIYGNFKIEIALNDVLEVSALQYQSVKVIITQDVITSKQLRLFLVEELNKLNEVILLPSKLTGILEVDVENAKAPKIVQMNFGDVSNFEFPVDRFTKVDNPFMRQGQFYNGINFASIFGLNRLLNKPIKKQSLEALYQKQKNDLADKYSPTFFKLNFNIPLDRVEAFIGFVYSNGFDARLLKESNEMELLEFLLEQSKLFLKIEHEKN